MLGEHVLNSVPAQWFAAYVGKESIAGLGVSLTKPRTEDRDRFLCAMERNGICVLFRCNDCPGPEPG